MAQATKSSLKKKAVAKEINKVVKLRDVKEEIMDDSNVVDLKPIRRGRPPLGPSRRIPKLIQLDPRVDTYITQRARESNRPYQSIINDYFLQLISERPN